MGIIDSGVCLSSFQVHWSVEDATFVARSDRYPGLVACDEFSSLAAVDGLIDLIEQQERQDHSSRRPAA
ncbi:hypothetical protein D7D52_16530 [Nocardia yunnanensis]|uniref:Uncharacterized protein n=1 Tax=Nocardia yunnanensis TaxID=2382165 RepID=A0A386ZDK5_9NOCA|nr:hypothetical protein [Nocardia yunnanensis]AYF75204.1 hypothetical protein D7D52_16530 [Nocardia yunnanensis]